MANQILTRQEITYEPLRILENELKILPGFYRDYDKEFGKGGGKIGDTLYIRKPQRFVGRDGSAYVPEGMVDTQTPITINQQSGVDFEMSTADLYLSIDDLSQRTLKPAAVSIANKLDYRAALTAMQNTANMVGTPGTTPGLSGSDAFYIYGQAGKRLDDNGFPLRGDRRMVLNPQGRLGWITYSKAFFNPTGGLSEQWKTGQISNALGDNWFEDQNIPVQTIGALGGTPAVAGANQTGTSVNLSGLTASITNWGLLGDIISFAGCYEVNPQSRQSTGVLRQFVLQANVSSDSGGLATVTILPAIVPSGQFQNVTASPANGALVNVYDTAAAGQSALAGLATPQNLLYQKDSFGFCSFPGQVPKGVDMGYEGRAPQIGVSLRFVRISSSVLRPPLKD